MRDPRRNPLALLPRLALGLLVAVAAVGCLFEPRTPETGDAGPVCFEASPQSTGEVNIFFNLEGSFKCLQTQTYLDQLGDDFEFIPAPGFDLGTWGLEREQEFLDRLFADVQEVRADLNIDPQASGTQERLYEADYVITVVSRDGSEIEYTGRAFYTLVQRQTLWYMIRWEEQASANPFSAVRSALAP